MIDNLLGNKTNISILRFLVRFDTQFFSIEEIVKETGAGLRNVHDSLNILNHENILMKKVVSGRVFYRFVVDSRIKSLIFDIFDEEKKRIILKEHKNYKIVSEIESKIIKVAGSNLIDIILFGSLAKGRDTSGSDIDLCVLIKRKDADTEKKIKAVSFENKFKSKVQIHVFTSGEFLAADRKGNPLVKNILRDGITLRIAK